MIIFFASASVVFILYVGAQAVLTRQMSAGTLGQFVLFAVFAASGLGQLSEVWGEISQAAGSAERLTELLAIEPTIKAPESFTLAGKPLARLDTAPKCTGQAAFGIDTRLPDMLYAAVALCPVPGGTVKSARRRKSRKAASLAGRFSGFGGGPPRGAFASSAAFFGSGFFPTVDAGGGAGFQVIVIPRALNELQKVFTTNARTCRSCTFDKSSAAPLNSTVTVTGSTV